MSYAGYEASNAVLGNGQWAGEADNEGLWIGGEFAQPVQVTSASLDVFGEYETLRFDLEYLSSDGKWEVAQELLETPASDPSHSGIDVQMRILTENADSARDVVASLSRGCPSDCGRAINEQLMLYAWPLASLVLPPELEPPGDRRALGLEVRARVEG